MTVIPELDTERLRLRAFEERDFDAYAAMMGDPEVARYLGTGRALDRMEAWRQMAMFLGHWQLRGYGVWAVEEKATGAFVGRIGHQYPEGFPDFELAYTLARPFWGRGYALEGARAARDYAWNVLGRERMVSIVRHANVGSRRVAERLGATLDGEVEFFGAPSLLYVHPRPATAAMRANS